jgi:Family of unknown function (DUF5343)
MRLFIQEVKMASFPYISGAGNVSVVFGLLRKNFPAAVTADTIKKYQIASNNESYLINTLQFLGFLDSESKKTQVATDVFSLHDDDEFQAELGKVIERSYRELFELHGENAWSLDKKKLIGYFRHADKTSEVIGTRQAALFQVLAVQSGKLAAPSETAKQGMKPSPANNTKPKVLKQTDKPKATSLDSSNNDGKSWLGKEKNSAVSLNVRVEINLPAGASAENYDAIFKSIREHIMNG